MRYVESYQHQNRIGVLVELETPDLITLRCKEFKDFALDLSLQIAAFDPDASDNYKSANLVHIRREEVNRNDDHIRSLLKQAWIKDQDTTVEDVLTSLENLLKTTIRIVRFTRYSTNDT